MHLNLNESSPDRIIRIVIGVVLAALAVTGAASRRPRGRRVGVAAILLVTGVVGFCPLYAILRISTKARAIPTGAAPRLTVRRGRRRRRATPSRRRSSRSCRASSTSPPGSSATRTRREDCAQETIVGAWRRRDQLRDPAGPRGLAPAEPRQPRHRPVAGPPRRARHRRGRGGLARRPVVRGPGARPRARGDARRARGRPARLPVVYRVAVRAPRRARLDRRGDRRRDRRRAAGHQAAPAEGPDDARERPRRGRRAAPGEPRPSRCAAGGPAATSRGTSTASWTQTTRAAVEAHLETCPTCPPLYASLVGVRATLGGLRDPDSVVEDAMALRIRDRLSLARAAGVTCMTDPESDDRGASCGTSAMRPASPIESHEPDRHAGGDLAATLTPGRALDLAVRRRAPRRLARAHGWR